MQRTGSQKRRVPQIFLVLLIFCSLGVEAAEIGDFAPLVYDTSTPDTLRLRGDIDIRTPISLSRALRQFPQIKNLELSSLGGNLMAALSMALDIRNAGLKTTIAEGQKCYSACAFLYFSGVERSASGKLGVHQVAGGNAASSQFAVGDIVTVLNDFNVPSEVIVKMLQTPPDKMYEFSTEEMYRLRLTSVATTKTTENVPESQSIVDGLGKSYGQEAVRNPASFTPNLAGLTANTKSNTKIMQSDAWGAYVYDSKGAEVCYVLSIPNHSVPTSVDHGDIFFVVSRRPGQNGGYEPQAILAYALKESSKVIVNIDGQEFTLFTRGTSAWVENAAKEPQLVAAMKAGTNMTVRAVSRRGTNTFYSYSLKGMAAALNQIAICNLDMLNNADVMAAMRGQIQKYWNIIPGMADGGDVRVIVKMRLDLSGNIVGEPDVTATGGSASTRAALSGGARRAVLKAQPFQLPKEKFDSWANVIVNFDPSQMF